MKQHKNPGISLAVAFISSMFVLFLAMYTFNSITKSYARTVAVERGNKVFFAAESAIEAALFHKNSRTKNAHFDWESWDDPAGSGTYCKDMPFLNATCRNWYKSVGLNLVNAGATARWKLLSRFVPEDGSDIGTTVGDDVDELTYKSELKEFQTVEIPLFYDDALRPIELDGGTGALVDLTDPTIRFFSEAPIVASDDFNFGDERFINNSLAVKAKDLPDTERRENIVIDWSVSRYNNNKGIQNFLPNNDFDPQCFLGGVAGLAIICESELQDAAANQDIDMNVAHQGTILPCLNATGCKYDASTNPTITLQHFMNGSDAESSGDTVSNYKLRLEPLVPFEHIDPGSPPDVLARIESIPFHIILDDPDDQLPQDIYTVVADVDKDGYEKTVTFEVRENTSLGAFNYVIFD